MTFYLPKDASNQCIELIKRSEGLRLKAYADPGTGGDPWTIGYGHTRNVKPGQMITEDKAHAFLLEDIQNSINAIRNLVKVTLSQSQFDALVSFVFNIGESQFSKSTLLRLLNQGKYDDVPAQLSRWNRAAGKVLPGLVRRRKEEFELWTKLCQ